MLKSSVFPPFRKKCASLAKLPSAPPRASLSNSSITLMLKAPRAIRPKKPLHVDFVSTRGNRFNSRFGPRILRIPTDSRQNKTLDSSQPGGSQDGSPSNGGKLRKPRESQSQRNDRATGFTWFTRNPSLVVSDSRFVDWRLTLASFTSTSSNSALESGHRGSGIGNLKLLRR